MTQFRNTLERLLTFYGDLGFFAGRDRQKLLDEMESSLVEGGSTPETDNPALDLMVLAWDADRVVFESPVLGEALAPGNEAYVQMVRQLAAISRGHFQPQGISEIWKGNKGPVLVEFTLEGDVHRLRAEVEPGGKLDENILFQINLLLLRTGFQFELIEYQDQQGGVILFLALLGEHERFLMERERKLPFTILSLTRVFRPLALLGEPPDLGKCSTFVGTVNEFLDRSVGRLELTLEGDQVRGTLAYDGKDHREALEFRGVLEREAGLLSGQIGGRVANQGEEEDYTGFWAGRLEPGGKLLCGTWKGWVGEQEPADKGLLNMGEWVGVHARWLETDHPHLARVRAWLEGVWKARSLQEFPWSLPLPSTGRSG